MTGNASRSWKRLTFFVCLSCIVGVALEAASHADSAGNSQWSPIANLIALNMKFESSMSCSNGNCHGQPVPQSGPPTSAEYSVWSQKDRHSKAFATLQTQPAAAIGTKLGISDVTTSGKCLECHAVDVPAALQDNQFAVAEGVTCDACHGPSEKWIGPHPQNVGNLTWADNQRKNGNAAAILQNTGFNDLKSPFARAENCTKCHLAIDATMVAAGHPQPAFEIVEYSLKEPKHWVDPRGYFNVKLWSVGQAVCVDESMRQLSERAGGAAVDAVNEAYQQAAAHALIVSALLDNKVFAGDAGGFKTHVQSLIAAGAKQPADTQTLGTEASALATISEGLFPAADAIAPADAATLGVLRQIAGNQDLSKNFGRRGAEQQEYAIYWLYYAYAAAQKIPTDGDTVKPLIKQLFAIVKFADQAPLTSDQLDQFAKIVVEIYAALPTQ
jgi:hypothetical protein